MQPYTKPPFSHLKHNFIAKIGLMGHRKLKFLKKFEFFPQFCPFSLLIDPLFTFNGQKRSQHPRLQRNSFFLSNKIHKIGQTGPKTVKNQSKTTYFIQLMGMLGVWVGQEGLTYVSPKNLCDDELLLLTIFCHTMSFRCAEILLRPC